MSEDYYDIAQICLNGHVINSSSSRSPEFNEKFCSSCGKETITSCGKCNKSIRGYYHMSEIIAVFDYSKPAYCPECGNPYPWTITKMSVAEEVADELSALSADEKLMLKESFPDLINETPKTPLAEKRFKSLVKKAGTEAYNIFKVVLSDILSESVRKSIFGG